MSSITFHEENATLGTVQGSERQHALEVAIDTCLDVLGATSDAEVNRLIHQGVLPRDATAFTAFGETPVEALRGWMRDLMGSNSVSVGSELVPVAHAVLNTAAVEGPDAVAFLARLHGSVEDRIWVDSEDVQWFAMLLDIGCAEGHLRADAGWEDVIAPVANASGPIVITSSQGQAFPDETYDKEMGESMPVANPASRWRDSLDRLRQAGWWLQLTPENLREPAYASFATLHDLRGARQ